MTARTLLRYRREVEPVRVHRIRGLVAASYLIETHEGLFVVDAGFIGHGKTVLDTIRRLGRTPDELRLAIVTHVHLDHFGGLSALRAEATFDTVVHPVHAAALGTARHLISPAIRPGWSAYETLARLSMRHLPVRGVDRVLPLPDGWSLHGHGLPGRIVHTPGHSDGCISLLLDDGTAFVGDLVQGKRLPTLRPELPSMASSVPGVHASWRRLLTMGARDFMPAHAAPFTAEELRATMRRDGVLEPLGISA